MTQRCGFVAIIGAPNAGKSTLVNRLVGAKVAIVTHKVQTTRSRILGILTTGESQLVLIDTPGIFAPRRRLDRAMVAAAWSGAKDADETVLVIDSAKAFTPDVERIVEALAAAERPVTLALNKVDLVRKDVLLALSAKMSEYDVFRDIFMISASTGDGVADLRDHLGKMLPEGPWHYPEDQISDVTQRLMAAEVTREKVYLRLHEELPYAITVETENWKEQKDGSVRIDQVIYVDRKSHKGMVIGKGGSMLKALGAAARKDLEADLGCRVHLFLHVKQVDNWSEARSHLAAIGLDYVE